MCRFLRYLRIGWTAFCGIACLLLCVLWIRSYSYLDKVIHESPTGILHFSSRSGNVQIEVVKKIDEPESAFNYWKVITCEVGEEGIESDHNWMGVGYVHIDFYGYTSDIVTIAYYYPVVTLVLLSGISWIPWSNRFSLRTLLIAMTLVAVVLGLIVWSNR